jgi:hypothetical protein
MEKNKPDIIEGFRAVDFMRTVRNQISLEIQDLSSFAELKKYFEERRRKIRTINLETPPFSSPGVTLNKPS